MPTQEEFKKMSIGELIAYQDKKIEELRGRDRVNQRVIRSGRSRDEIFEEVLASIEHYTERLIK